MMVKEKKPCTVAAAQGISNETKTEMDAFTII